MIKFILNEKILVPERLNFAQAEEEVLEFWKKIDAFETTLKRSEGKPLYTFYDGPPFATGTPHYGHILAGTIKVFIINIRIRLTKKN